jgi:hypothetical protein
LNIQASSSLEIVKDIKEKLAYVAMDYEKEIKEFDDDSSKE